MASISPTSVQCSDEPHTSKNAYLKLTITSISDSDASTNERYIGWKLTVEGTPWVALYAYSASLGGVSLTENLNANVTGWSAGQIIASGTKTYSNDSSGNLTLTAYVKQLFYLYYSASRWSSVPSKAQEASVNMVCSQLPRYAAFTSHSCSTEINKINVTYSTDVGCNAQQYSLDGGAWTNCSAGSYSITGLTPGSSHTIKTRVKRTDSGLWTESNSVSVTMKSLPTPNNVADISFSNNAAVSVSISSVSYISAWYIKIYDGNTSYRDGSDNPNHGTSTNDYWVLYNGNNMLPNHSSANSWPLTIQFYVVSNGVTYNIGSKTCNCILPTGQYTPIFNTNNISYEVTDTQSLNLTGSNKKVIKGISDIQVSCTSASPQGGASMNSYSATSGNSVATTTVINNPVMNLTNVTGNSVVVQAIDSRNRTTTATKNYDAFIDYFIPTISSASIGRVDGVGTNINVSITGKYCNWSGLNTTNVITQVSLQYKLKSSSNYSTISGVNLTITNNSGNFTATGIITGNLFNAANEYDLLITLQDKITNLIYKQTIPTSEALLWRDLSNNRIGIGKKPTKELDVNGSVNTSGAYYINGTNLLDIIYPIGSIYMSMSDTTATAVHNRFGGTWEQISMGRCIIGTGVPTANGTNFFGDLGVDPSTFYFGNGEKGGQYYHTLNSNEIPKHGHTQYLLNPSESGYAISDPYFGYGVHYILTTGNVTVSETTKGWINSAATGYFGGSQKHNTMPPYYAVYIWKRTA